MSRDDGYTRYTVRIPTPLYERVKKAAGEASVNSLIVQLLEREYPEVTDVMWVHLDHIRDALDRYEKSDDPKERLYLQHMVEMMATIGHDLRIEGESIFPWDIKDPDED